MALEGVAQVSVRLSEGGAAGVARALSDGLRARGIFAPFVYGYGPGGHDSPLEAEYGATRITPLSIAGLNRIAYRTIGKDTGLKSPGRWADFRGVLESVDVVHLHVLHTYFVSTEGLFELLADVGKPVVWTLHDQWAMTGRCAQPAGCELWRQGCTRCPDLRAYPEAWVDNAATRWRERRQLIGDLQERVPTSIVACANWLADAARDAGFDNVTTVQNSVDAEFWDQLSGPGSPSARSVLFVCRDLRDRGKVDWDLLEFVSQIPGAHLTIVGDNSPVNLPTARRLPATASRAELARLMQDHEALLFTSDVDYFPLTIAEALSAGMHVVARDSSAAREFAASDNVSIFSSREELRDALSIARVSNPDTAMRAHLRPERMIDDYVRVYEELTS